jgi:glycosyltransferase involved in cell wall biosynthesis
MKKILLIVDTQKWAFGYLAQGIRKAAPSAYKVDVIDGQRMSRMFRELPHQLREYDAACHFSWVEAPMPTARKPIHFQRYATVVASHGLEHPYPNLDPLNLATSISTQLRNDVKAKERLPHFDRVLCVSDRLVKPAQQFSTRVVRVVPGVDDEFFSPEIIAKLRAADPDKNRRFTVGWCAQVPPEGRNNTKGAFEVLLPIMQRMGFTTPGTGEVEFIVNGRAAFNAYTRPQMQKWFSLCDVILSTSCSEGFQMPLLEGASCGLPVIATRVGGADELVRDGENGILLPVWTTKENAEIAIEAGIAAIRRLAADKELYRRMSDEARETVLRDYTWKRRSREWLEAIEGA